MRHDGPAASGVRTRRFGPWRRLLFVLQGLLLTGLPFVRVGGESALRFDVPSLNLYFFGHTLFIQEFFLLLVAILAAVFFFVFLTAWLGRVWCGWLCPQSALLEFQEAARDLLRRLRLPGRVQDLFLFPVFQAALALLVSATLLAYFVPPGRLCALLSGGADAAGARVARFFLVFDAALVYLVSGYFGRRFCRSVCPYARLQGMLFDRGTLVIAFDPERRRECMGCDLCVEVCPTGIDIKDGLQMECVACARCIDACRRMTSRRGIAPLVAYRFGGGGWRRPSLLLSGAAALLFAGLLAALAGRAGPMEFTVTRSPGPLYLTGRGGEVLNRYRLGLQNKTASAVRLRLSVAPAGFRLAAPERITLGPRERGVIRATVIAGPAAETGTRVFFELRNEETGFRLRKAAAFYGPGP